MMVITRVHRDNGVTLAEVRVVGAPLLGEDVVSGSASKDRVDDRDKVVGDALAIGRALEKLGKRMQRRALGVVKNRDDVREQKIKQRANSQSRPRFDEKPRWGSDVRIGTGVGDVLRVDTIGGGNG